MRVVEVQQYGDADQLRVAERPEPTRTDDGQAAAGLVPWFVLGGATGTNAEVLLADPEWLAPVPEGVDPAEAATAARSWR